jgi:hypothetical protein
MNVIRKGEPVFFVDAGKRLPKHTTSQPVRQDRNLSLIIIVFKGELSFTTVCVCLCFSRYTGSNMWTFFFGLTGHCGPRFWYRIY